MDCIFNATFFQPLFKKIKMLKKKRKEKKKAREALWLRTLSVRGGGGHSRSSALHSRDILPPPAFWVSSFNTLNLQAECTSLKKLY